MPVPVCIFPTLHDSSAKPRFALVVALDGLGHLQLIKQRIVVTALRVAQQWVEIA
jgi:hypothetical protein